MVRRLLFLCCVLMLSLVALAQRSVENMNREWCYQIGDDIRAAVPGYDDRKWQRIGLPHSFSIPYFLSKDFYVGYGWYRKRFQVKKTSNECLFLEFDGVFQEAEVYVNGKMAGHHVGGYTAFCVDITPYVKNGENLVAVRVNNKWQPTVAPRGGEHVFSGGIYRGVRLVHKSSVAHIRWQGITITTPTLEQNKGQSSVVQVKVDIENRHAKKLRQEICILDAAGKEVGHGGDEISNPHLWSPSTPYIYKAVVSLYDGKRLLDQESVNFGFRWFHWSKDTGFWLNGEHLFFHGVNVHQDQAGWGDAVTEEAARRDVRMMKQAGFNMIRGSHYPHSQFFVDECDRQGVLFWSEAPFWGTAGPKEDGWWTASSYPKVASDTAAFEKNVLEQLEEMIVQHRNHPSVFVWSMCNEPFFTSSGTMPGIHRLLRRMVNLAHHLDPTRMAAIGGAQRPLGKERIDLIGDVAGYNGDGANIADFQHPSVPSVISEYGSTTADRPGKYTAGWGDLNRDEGWRGRDWRSGQAIWCGFDHGSLFGEDMAKMGIVDYFRIPKQSWYWYRQYHLGIAPPPDRIEGKASSVSLKASKNQGIRADGTDDVQLIASILDADGQGVSNSPAVTFRVKSGPGEFPTGRSITFDSKSDMSIRDGQCAIAFRSYFAGRTVIEAVSDGLKSDSVMLDFVGDPACQPGVSPQVEDRPYVRYTKTDKQLQTYGKDSPTFATSFAVNHSSGLAADGNAQTYWQPSDDDNSSAWTLDVERTLLLKEIHAKFLQDINAIIEISADQETWTEVGQANRQQVDVLLESTPRARFIRLRFGSGSHPQLVEATVRGFVP